ncbi:branched-chain amino acid ABC transporter ATP-binding protein [Frondihabitans sucicola]|uniref:Branched-chain amino acid ABC transporter ATP-binding protein n=1 Tax=Frondihabitans sucicola TaxID=1268041 RepID=A0ABN6XW40_9MICO|nr:ABC transporter ATP-binding protein [Frondihabitans sucicola]BDZ47865.1 branched-chain amino acid ABC transporter ATP-binding protein [Frondihabitans sucicola]
MTSTLTVTGLSASYGLASALKSIDLRVEKGRCVGLLGRNGAGKTTLLKSIVADPEITVRGDVAIDGRSLRKLATYKVARLGVAWVPDTRRIFTRLTVAENLDIARRRGVASDQLERVLEAVPLVRGLLKRAGYELSGGEQQAVTIARALMSAPDFLLLDEPTEGLSPLIVEQLQASIARLPEIFDLGVVVAEQNFRFVTDLADEVHVLETGEMVWSGTPELLVSDPDLVDRHLSVGEK